MKWQSSGAGSASLVLVFAFALVGCETNAQTGTLVGAGAGAGLGAIIGNNSGGHTGTGALIGAGVGAVGGYMVGNEVDKAEQRKRDAANQNSVRNNREQRYEPAPAASNAERVSKKDVIQWTDKGVKDDIIIDRIDRSHTVFNLTAADENELRDAGVSEEVVRAMKDTARR
jgi:uncharacterized protein YcfJ